MANIKSISAEEFKELINTNQYIIIDIRTPQERLPEHGGSVFEKSINIDSSSPNFQKDLNNLDKNKKYLIYCRSGYRTEMTLELMKDLGFQEVFDLEGGVLGL